MRIAVTVDARVCMGNQLCLGEASSVFELDDGGRARVLRSSFTEADLATLRSAEALCPTGAIRVEAGREEVA